MIIAAGGEGGLMIISKFVRSIPLSSLPSIPDPLSCPWPGALFLTTARSSSHTIWFESM